MDNHRLKGLALKPSALFLIAAVWLVPASAAPVHINIQIAGCALMTEVDGCMLKDSRTLDVWVAHDLNEPVRLRAADQWLSEGLINPSGRVQGGSRFSLRIPDGARTLAVFVGHHEWNMSLGEYSLPDVLVAARDFMRTGELRQSVNLIERAWPAIDARWHGDALRLLGQSQRRLGEFERAKASLTRSIAADRQAGKSSGAIRTMTVLAFTLMEEGEFSKARALLQQDMSALESDADSRYNLHYFRGLLAFNTSNARLAIDHFSEASRQAQRTGSLTKQVFAEDLLAVQLQRIGRSADADRYLSRWMNNIPVDMPACDEAILLTNVGWTRLLLLESGEPVDNPVEILQRADDLTRLHCTSRDRGNTLTNLALAELHARNIDRTEQLLGDVRSLENLNVRTVLWLLDIEARIELARGRAEAALSKYRRLEELALATVSVPARWRAYVGMARSFTADSNIEDALATYGKAERLLTDFLPSIPIDQGREALLNARSRATREHVDLLLAAGRDAEAFAIAREARVRSIRSISLTDRVDSLSPEGRVLWEDALTDYRKLRDELDETARNAWMLPADELAEMKLGNQHKEQELRAIIDRASMALGGPMTGSTGAKDSSAVLPGGINRAVGNNITGAPDVIDDRAGQPGPQALAVPDRGELMVLMSATPDGWAVFVHNGERLSILRPDCKHPASPALATCLIRPVIGMASDVDAIRILPTGVLTEVDFHALVIDGVPLIERIPVLYALDLPVTGSTLSGRGAALLVADSGGDLAAARKELDAVSTMLDAAKGWRQQQLTDSGATASAVRAALPKSQLFHFAGHARYSGEFGWDSKIMLSQDTALGIADIITLASAPPVVVLSGCETARTHASSFAQSMGLATAFLLAGTNSVLATSRPVRDSTAEQLMIEFYRHWTGGSPPRVALRNAQLTLMETRPQSDWAAYRLIER